MYDQYPLQNPDRLFAPVSQANLTPILDPDHPVTILVAYTLDDFWMPETVFSLNTESIYLDTNPVLIVPHGLFYRLVAETQIGSAILGVRTDKLAEFIVPPGELDTDALVHFVNDTGAYWKISPPDKGAFRNDRR